MMADHSLKADGAALKIYLDGPDWDGICSATIGNFTCDTVASGVALIRQAIDRIRAAGRDRVLAPMEGDTWHGYRVVTESDGSPPFLMEPAGKPLVAEAFRAAGFMTVGRYFSARMSLDEAAGPTPAPTDAFAVEAWDGKDPDTLFRQVFSLSSKAFVHNAFYKPISEEAFLALYAPLAPVIRPELVFLARRPDGTLAGFLFAIPDYLQGPEPKTVIIKTYASLERGAGRRLVHACRQASRALGYETVVHALIHEANPSAERSAREGGKVFRRYELLGIRFDG